MDDPLDVIIADAIEQAEALLELDAVRAEVWASDLAALAQEADPAGLEAVIEALGSHGGPSAAAALWAIDAVADGVDLSDPALEPAPPWADQLLTSTCEGAWLVSDWRGASAAFRFVDGADGRHVVLLDLVPGAEGKPETIGEATVGPGELLDAIDDEDSSISSSPLPATELASRVAAAARATSEPTGSFVAIGRLVVSRLSTLGVETLSPPEWVEPEVPDLPARDPDDDAWALGVVKSALGDPPPVDVESFATAAQSLRAAAAADLVEAQWLAASVGPVDLDEADDVVVLAAIAAAVAPGDLGPLTAAARDAVLGLEHADWIGAIIGLVRTGPGASAMPETLVDYINRCPEVTSTIPKSDRPRVAWSFGVATELWTSLGLVVDGSLTEFGSKVLPSVLATSWAPFNSPS